MSAVSLVREAIVNGKRNRQTLNLGRGRRPKNLAEGSFYLRYYCPSKASGSTSKEGREGSGCEEVFSTRPSRCKGSAEAHERGHEEEAGGGGEGAVGG
jgi:hypothetical protein